MPFYKFEQYNPEGILKITPAIRDGGVGHTNLVEAQNPCEANVRFDAILDRVKRVVSFCGLGEGFAIYPAFVKNPYTNDACECCGSRFYDLYDDAEPLSHNNINAITFSADSEKVVFVHFADGRVVGFGNREFAHQAGRAVRRKRRDTPHDI